MSLEIKNIKYCYVVLQIALVFLCSFSSEMLFSQPALPQRSITVTATQPFNFGTFTTGGTGGTVTIGFDGSRSSTGAVFLLSMAPTAQPAIFEVKLCEGRNVSITFSPSTILTGSNGGTLTMEIGPTEKGPSGSVFPTISDCNFVTPMRVGGTLIIPSGNVIPGTYTGSFEITFNQE